LGCHGAFAPISGNEQFEFPTLVVVCQINGIIGGLGVLRRGQYPP
jgi:hypothetical protein